MLDHDIFARESESRGLQSYLAHREQFVEVNNCKPPVNEIAYGALRWFTLRRFLITVYVNHHHRHHRRRRCRHLTEAVSCGWANASIWRLQVSLSCAVLEPKTVCRCSSVCVPSCRCSPGDNTRTAIIYNLCKRYYSVKHYILIYIMTARLFSRQLTASKITNTRINQLIMSYPKSVSGL